MFVLSTGRSAARSIVNTLNSLPGIRLSGNGLYALGAAKSLFRKYQETLAREAGAVLSHSRHASPAVEELLCEMQKWFELLTGMSAGAQPPSVSAPANTTFGFSALLVPSGSAREDNANAESSHARSC